MWEWLPDTNLHNLMENYICNSEIEHTPVVSLALCLTWQQHSFLPHYSVKATGKILDEIKGVGHSGCLVDVLCGHSVWVHCTVRYIISYRARKQHGLLGQRWGEEREKVKQPLLKSSGRVCSVCVVVDKQVKNNLLPGWQCQCDSWASRDSDLWCHDHL